MNYGVKTNASFLSVTINSTLINKEEGEGKK